MKVIREEGHTIGDLEALLRESNFNGFPVVSDANGDMIIVGFCTRSGFARSEFNFCLKTKTNNCIIGWISALFFDMLVKPFLT
jgi:hypothetical protein